MLIDSGLVRTKHAQPFENAFLSNDRVQHDICSYAEKADLEQVITAGMKIKNFSVQISTYDSYDGDTNAVGDKKHVDNIDLDVNLLIYIPVHPRTHGGGYSKSGNGDDRDGDGDDGGDEIHV